MKKLTELSIRALKPKATDYFVRDPSAPGFGVRVRVSGRVSFGFVYDFHGRRRRLVFGEYNPKGGLTLEAARRLYTKAAAALAEGRDPADEKQQKRENAIRAHAEKARHPTVNELAALYMEHHARAKKRSWREDQRILSAGVLPVWGARKAKDITRAEVNRLLDGIASRGAGVMANRTLSLVRKLFNFAIGRDLLNNQANPAALVERRAAEKPRERVLSADEIRDAWSGLDAAPMARLTVLALKLVLVTGQRPGEVLELEWSEIEGDWWTIPSDKSKNKLAHRVYLSEPARALLDELRTLAPAGRYAFPGARDSAKPMTVAALSRAVLNWLQERQIENRWTPHDLRRTCGTNMGRLGISRFVQDKVLNHKDRTIGATYDLHEYDREKRAALERWGAALSELLTGNGSAKVVAFRGKPIPSPLAEMT